MPDVLRSGNHKKIDEYRHFKAIEKTEKNREDLLNKKLESEEFQKEYKKYKKHKEQEGK